jgi:hypothetical protein
MRCCHTVGYRIQGILLNDGQEQELLRRDSEGVLALLTTNPDPYLLQGDRSLAIAEALLNSWLGPEKIGKFPEWLGETVARIQQKRKEQFGAGPYLVVQSDSDQEVTLGQHRELDDFVVCFDAIDKDAVRVRAAPTLDRLLSSLLIVVNRIVGYDKVADSVVLLREDGKMVFSFSPRVSGDLIVSTSVATETYEAFPKLYDQLSDRKGLNRVVRLLAASLEQYQDRFRAFLAAWMAIEIFVNKVFSQYEQSVFSSLTDGTSGARNRYFGRMRTVMKDKYGLADRFALIASELSPDTADEDLKSFQKAKEARDELSHGQEVEDSKLPVEAARLLVKRYLIAHLNRSA